MSTGRREIDTLPRIFKGRREQPDTSRLKVLCLPCSPRSGWADSRARGS